MGEPQTPGIAAKAIDVSNIDKESIIIDKKSMNIGRLPFIGTMESGPSGSSGDKRKQSGNTESSNIEESREDCSDMGFVT